MNKALKWVIIIVCILLVVGVAVWLRVRSFSGEHANYEIATIWNAQSVDPETLRIDFSNASDRVRLARRGFERGLAAGPHLEGFEEVMMAENQDQRYFAEAMADLFGTHDILLTIGATTDEITMNASMEMNYFNIPMLIPFSDGDLSSDNSSVNYSIRMTPTAQKYAEYVNDLFSSNYFTLINNVFFQDIVIPEYDINVAVYFTDNFNGHNTAVNVTQKIIDNGYNVEIYTPFKTLTDLQYIIQTSWQTEADKLNAIDSIVIIGEDGAPINGLASINRLWKDRGLEPLIFLIGFLPYGIEQDVMNARNIFAIQQALDLTNCPADIVNRSEAMGYAAGYIVSKTLNKALEIQSPEPGGFQLLFSNADRRRELHQDYLAAYRENVRSILLDMDEMIPCYGLVDFNINSDANIFLELVRYTGPDQMEQAGTGVMLDYVIDKVRNEFNLSE